MRKSRKLLSTQTLVSLGVLAAMSVVLTRFFPIDLGFARFSLGSVPAIIGGLWFGPFCGGLIGLTADLIGSFLQGYAPNPVITAAAVLWGVIPAIALRWAVGTKARRIVILCVSIILTSVVCTLGITTLGLTMLGYELHAIFMTRVFQFSVMTPIYCILVSLLYFSPITAYLSSTRINTKGSGARNCAV